LENVADHNEKRAGSQEKEQRLEATIFRVVLPKMRNPLTEFPLLEQADDAKYFLSEIICFLKKHSVHIIVQLSRL